MPHGAIRQDDQRRNRTASGAGDPSSAPLAFAALAVVFAVCQAAVMFVLRSGLPTPALAFAIGPALVACTTLAPALWARKVPGRFIWIGPIALAVLLLGIVLVSLGLLGQLLLFAAALALIVVALRTGAQGIASITRWVPLLLIILVMSVILISGNKYLNFVADQLALAGRTDGDILMHAALMNAIRYFDFPSSGIDGLQFNRYHFGIDILGALMSRGTGFDVLLSMMTIRTLVLFPLAVFGAAWSGLVIARRLRPEQKISGAFALAAAAVAVVLVLQNSLLGNLTLASDPLLLAGVIMVLSAPTVIWLLTDASGDPAARYGWWLALAVIPFLSAAKVSVGFVWTGLVCWWALRQLGPMRLQFWIVGAVAAALFIPGYFLFADPTGAGAVLFGTPYFVGLARDGHYLEPLRMHFQALMAILGLVFLVKTSADPRRFLIEALVIALLIGLLPGMVMDIPGADAYYFIVVVGWFAVPILVALLAGLPAQLRTTSTGRRRIGWTAVALVAVIVIVLDAKPVPLQFNIFMANNALLHTGDRSYYDQDNRKGWREDGARARKELGLIGLFRLPPPPPLGSSLVEAMLAFKAETGAEGAAYLEPQSDYWPLVSDCDGKATYPMSMAGLPVIDGYLPVQADCPQQFSLRGYGDAPATRSTLSDADLCTRVKEKGFATVLRIQSLTDRSTDRRLACR